MDVLIHDLFVKMSMLGIAWLGLKVTMILYWEEIEDKAGSTTDYIEIDPISRLHRIQQYLLSILLVISWFKFLTFVSLLPIIGPYIQATMSTFVHLRVISFLSLFLFFTWSISIGLYVAFGQDSEVYMSIAKSFLAVFQSMFGELFQDDMQAVDYWFGTVTFLVISLIGALTLMNIFIAVVSNVYEELLGED
eukprot:GFYU01008446.1.p1 GENE.GFYU01008446.1~~GFYU01008446.1.p1  ORF type:complete len:219 (+),score=70.78 GFYU01008446.1:82-657(+)